MYPKQVPADLSLQSLRLDDLMIDIFWSVPKRALPVLLEIMHECENLSWWGFSRECTDRRFCWPRTLLLGRCAIHQRFPKTFRIEKSGMESRAMTTCFKPIPLVGLSQYDALLPSQ